MSSRRGRATERDKKKMELKITSTIHSDEVVENKSRDKAL